MRTGVEPYGPVQDTMFRALAVLRFAVLANAVAIYVVRVLGLRPPTRRRGGDGLAGPVDGVRGVGVRRSAPADAGVAGCGPPGRGGRDRAHAVRQGGGHASDPARLLGDGGRAGLGHPVGLGRGAGGGCRGVSRRPVRSWGVHAAGLRLHLPARPRRRDRRLPVRAAATDGPRARPGRAGGGLRGRAGAAGARGPRRGAAGARAGATSRARAGGRRCRARAARR